MIQRWFGLALAALMLVVGLAALPHLPPDVASHWDAAGHVNGTLPRVALVLPRIDPRARGESAFGPTYWLIMNAGVTFLGFTFLLTIAAGLHQNLAVARIMPAAIGILFLILGAAFGRVPPNWFVGIRTPWTLSAETVWRETHRAGGWVFAITGALMAVLSLVMPAETLVAIVLAGAIAPAAGLTLYSYLLWRRRHGGAPGAAGGPA